MLHIVLLCLLLLQQGAIDAARLETNIPGGDVGIGGVLLRKIVSVCISDGTVPRIDPDQVLLHRSSVLGG